MTQLDYIEDLTAVVVNSY